ncbi:MAG TPA: hypothetical protein DEH78_11475 [Solibacterales bacterium]|nr:hypothetical protein [Bryobacterales bacterium]
MDGLTVIGPYLLLTIGLCASLYQFVTVKRELWKERRVNDEERTRFQDSLLKLQMELESLKTTGPVAAPADAERAAAGAPLTAGMNLNKRHHVLRMYRRGDRPDQIAAALSLPQNEVDLLLKVHRVTIQNSGAAPTAAAAAAGAGPGAVPTV